MNATELTSVLFGNKSRGMRFRQVYHMIDYLAREVGIEIKEASTLVSFARCGRIEPGVKFAIDNMTARQCCDLVLKVVANMPDNYRSDWIVDYLNKSIKPVKI